ncbi:hypothetical protein M501DRAFT_1019289 [Patellaria atrata CBS 101060]|uniref:Uncharacterized protein n=1 Tax=Patellaria atrata CBS 101060 TaxID=1346257 RepID=A0A9P4S5M1_9PEZI|nr:hypothetical protein M501DRAFT_1019289 [Patellaria atrata CBS 101060]
MDSYHKPSRLGSEQYNINYLTYQKWRRLEHTRDSAIKDIETRENLIQSLIHEIRDLQVKKEDAECELLNDTQEVVPGLYKQANSILVLPREIRNKIYEELYPVGDPIPLINKQVSISRVGHEDSHYRYILNDEEFPIDPWRCLCAEYVGEQIASETAEWFYSSNTFRIGIQHREAFKELMEHDAYGSNIRPGDFIRRIQLDIAQYWQYDFSWQSAPPSLDFEMFGSEEPWTLARNQLRKDIKEVLSAFTKRTLHVELYVHRMGECTQVELRDFSPIVFGLLDEGSTVKVFLVRHRQFKCRIWPGMRPSCPCTSTTMDITELYRTVSEEDENMYYGSEYPVHLNQVENKAWARAFLREHYLMYSAEPKNGNQPI